jgi:hypothetical protein
VRLGHFLRLGSERNKVRQEIKSLLQDQGIELRVDIRKAMPSRFSNDNDIQAAPCEVFLEKI